MSYNVYNGEYPGVPNHGAILIETNPGVTRLAEAGRMYHVTGNLLMGMKFDPRNCIDPEGSVSFVPGTKRETSAIAKDDLAKFERERCDAVPPPRLFNWISGASRCARVLPFIAAEIGMTFKSWLLRRELFGLEDGEKA